MECVFNLKAFDFILKINVSTKEGMFQNSVFKTILKYVFVLCLKGMRAYVANIKDKVPSF